MNELRFNDLRFQVQRSDVRRVLEITVGRAGELILSAPAQANESRLRAFVQRKRFWVYQQLARWELLKHTLPVRSKQFVDGEGFAYLGRNYRLRLIEEPGSEVKLRSGRFVLPLSQRANGRENMIRWYCHNATRWLGEKTADYAARMEVAPAGVRVQDLGYRWGSCGKNNWLYFHWKTILLPARIAEYVVVHEMAHLHEAHHTPEFWRRVERAMPDFERRRDWLAAHGGAVEGL